MLSVAAATGNEFETAKQPRRVSQALVDKDGGASAMLSCQVQNELEEEANG